MEYQKIIKFLDYTMNQPSKSKTKNWVEINNESRGDYNDDDDNNNDNNNNIRFKTTMIRISLCNYSDAYIIVKGTITVSNTAAAGTAVNNTNKKVLFKNCVIFTTCITKINNTQVGYAEDINIVVPMYNLIWHSNAYLKTSGSLRQYYRDKPVIDANRNITDFPADDNNSNSFQFKQQIT